jgi:hypothetical protein
MATVVHHPASKTYEFIIAGFALLALLVVQWMLSSAIQGTNYDGDDGKMAHATILAAVKFAAPFQVTTLSPIQGIGSQLLPLNVWPTRPTGRSTCSTRGSPAMFRHSLRS